MSQHGDNYPERAINSLPKDLQVGMAQLSLQGFKFTCGDLTPVGNRWWTVRDPSGRPCKGVGGLHLKDVVERAMQFAEQRKVSAW